MKRADRLWHDWQRATVTPHRPVTAKAHATELLELLAYADEPTWSPQERNAFFAWCDRENIR